MTAEAQLQELYSLDHRVNGNMYLAWYGQCRAKEMTHKEAMADTIKYFHIDLQDWYINQQAQRAAQSKKEGF